jgi:Polyketide cyclase / dehydrase and lipid transport
MMMEALGIVALVVVIVVAAVLVLAAMRPDTFEIRRSTRITARPDKIFPLIADFHRWSAWSPFEKLDPAMTRTFGGAANGKGATYAWEGNRKAGQGRMEITDAAPLSRVTIAIDFMRPFKASNIVDLTLEPQGDATTVTWAMRGAVPYPAKIMHLVANVDRMVGRDFATGLANLKRLAES